MFGERGIFWIDIIYYYCDLWGWDWRIDGVYKINCWGFLW